MKMTAVVSPGRPCAVRSISLSVLVSIAVLAFLIFPSLASAAPGDGGAKTVEATGYASITGSDTASARDTAIEDALRKAVEKAVGTLVSSETMVENFEVLSDSIYTRTEGYVKEYKVKDEKQTTGMYSVTLDATVAVGSLKGDLDALGLLYARAGKPRVLFMVAEQNIGQKYYTFWWWGKSEYKGENVNMSAAETALKGFFIDKGFKVVDVSGLTGRFKVSNAFRVADLTDEGAREIGGRLNAELVIKGKALAKEGPRTPGSAVGSYLADITVQAIRVDDGAVLASARGHGVSRHVSDVTGGTEAIDRAASEVAEKLIEQISTKWSGPRGIILRVSGIDDYKIVARLKGAIRKKIRGVKAVYQRGFAKGVVTFEIETRSSARSAADAISALSGFDLDVTGTTGNTIDAVLKPASAGVTQP